MLGVVYAAVVPSLVSQNFFQMPTLRAVLFSCESVKRACVLYVWCRFCIRVRREVLGWLHFCSGRLSMHAGFDTSGAQLVQEEVVHCIAGSVQRKLDMGKV